MGLAPSSQFGSRVLAIGFSFLNPYQKATGIDDMGITCTVTYYFRAVATQTGNLVKMTSQLTSSGPYKIQESSGPALGCPHRRRPAEIESGRGRDKAEGCEYLKRTYGIGCPCGIYVTDVWLHELE